MLPNKHMAKDEQRVLHVNKYIRLDVEESSVQTLKKKENLKSQDLSKRKVTIL